ncbi:MAG: ABC transporter substrate-binding protein [Bacteroidota bacterium]
MICLLGLACGRSPDTDKSHFHYNESAGISSLDPAFAKSQATIWAAHQLFNTLVEVDSVGGLSPSAASRWDISEDRRSYTFHLRGDIFFHDDPVFPGGSGRTVRASDWVVSFQRLLDPAVASPGAWIFRGKVDTIRPFEALDDSTFRLNLLRPYHPILGILSMQYCSVVAPEAVQQYGADFRRHPVGSGPYRFAAWSEGQTLILKRHERYWERDGRGERLPYLSGIRISFYDSKATEFLLFRQGKLDFINDLDASFKDEVLLKTGQLKKQWAGKVVLQTSPYLNTEYLGIVMDTALAADALRSKWVRQAINCGFDRRKMILYLRNSLSTPAESGFVPEGLPSYDSAKVRGYRYDPVQAARLLAKAGYPGGKGLPPIRLQTIPIYAEMANFIARQLGEVGMGVQVDVVQKSLLLDLTAKGQSPFFRACWIADYPEAENYLSVFYSKNPAPPNYTRFQNKRFDEIFEQAIQEVDDSLRYGLYQEADRIIVDEAPVVPLWYDRVIRLVRPGVRDFYPTAQNLLELRKVRTE